MKKILLPFASLLLTLTAAHGQNCIQNFGFTISTNNVATMFDSSTSTCLLDIHYNYGDPQSGYLNNSSYPTSGFKHFYKNAGTYTICQYISTNVPCSNPCSDTLCKQIILSNNGSNCQAIYSFTSNGLSYSFTNLSSANDSITNILWDFNDGTISNTYSPNHFYPTQGNYIVCLYIQTSNGCQSVTCDTIMVNQSGINEYLNKNSISISPNPFSSLTTLRSNKNLQDAALTVYNLFGDQVKEMKNISSQSIILHRDNLPSGIYFLRLMQDNQTVFTDKLVITD